MASIMAVFTPGASDESRKARLKSYAACKPNKGHAVEVSSAKYYRACAHEDAQVTGERTLEACQPWTGKLCALLAVNEEIATEGEPAPKDMPRLHYAGKYDVSQIPILREVTRQRSDAQAYGAAAEPKAVAIHPWGGIFTSVGAPSPQEAQASALSKCNNDSDRRGRDGDCFVYAVNNDVIIDERRMPSK
jgi:hypothetical protein